MNTFLIAVSIAEPTGDLPELSSIIVEHYVVLSQTSNTSLSKRRYIFVYAFQHFPEMIQDESPFSCSASKKKMIIINGRA